MEVIKTKDAPDFHTPWMLDALREWEMTFDNERTSVPRLIRKIKRKEGMTPDEVQEFVFHLWQMAHGDLLKLE